MKIMHYSTCKTRKSFNTVFVDWSADQISDFELTNDNNAVFESSSFIGHV